MEERVEVEVWEAWGAAAAGESGANTSTPTMSATAHRYLLRLMVWISFMQTLCA
jgi:hypothetical protein